MADSADLTPSDAAPDLRARTEDLLARRRRHLEMGGPERVARQHAAGKLTVRERIDRLFDPGTFTELGLLAHHQSTSPQMQGKVTPADGVVCGVGRADGRLVAGGGDRLRLHGDGRLDRHGR